MDIEYPNPQRNVAGTFKARNNIVQDSASQSFWHIITVRGQKLHPIVPTIRPSLKQEEPNLSNGSPSQQHGVTLLILKQVAADEQSDYLDAIKGNLPSASAGVKIVQECK